MASQATSLLYAGEHFDTDSQNYYLRARWYDSLSGRFNRMDPFPGNNQDPQSLHKYLYTHCNPINGIDPSGRFSLAGALSTMSIIATVIAIIAPAIITIGAAGNIGRVAHRDPDAWVASFSLSILAPILKLGMGVGGEFSYELLYIINTEKVSQNLF